MTDSGQFVDGTERCENCNVAPDNFEKGHSYRETGRGIEYDVEHLNDLGRLNANGITLTFDRMNNRLIIERSPDHQKLLEELERALGTDTDRRDE